jgi:hypothetical protein
MSFRRLPLYLNAVHNLTADIIGTESKAFARLGRLAVYIRISRKVFFLCHRADRWNRPCGEIRLFERIRTHWID